MKRQAFALSISAVLSFFVLATVHARADTTNPDGVKIVTDDIPRFWQAYDSATRSGSLESVAAWSIFAYKYFAPGTPGLWAFVPGRLSNEVYLAKIVAQNRAYYEATRPYMQQIPLKRPAIVSDLVRFKALYPSAVFPNIYFVPGALNSGGTSKQPGLILGAEMNSRPPDFRGKAGGWLWSDLHTLGEIPAIVTHELMHYNQKDAEASSLLGGTIVEGSADFLVQKVDGSSDAISWSFGCAHEDALWLAFSKQMASHDDDVINTWLASDSQGPLGAPPNIGYWIGARITQAYYDTRPDKSAAIDAILHVTDYNAFLKASGYPAHRPPCRPESRATP